MNGFLAVEAGERAPQRLRRRALELADEVASALGRVATEAEAVHEARRRLKELRATVRLVGRALPRKGRQDRIFFRDAGRVVAARRDAEAVVETFDRLREHFHGEWKPREFLQIRRVLSERAEPPLDAVTVARIREDLAVERGRIAAWPVDTLHPSDLWTSIARSHRAARRGMQRAVPDGSPARFHRWRRRAKTLWYQEQFFESVGMAPFDAEIRTLHKLGRVLGEHHDVVLIDEICRTAPESFGSARYVQRFRRFLARRLRELEEKAGSIGQTIFTRRTRDWARASGSPLAKRVGPKASRERAKSPAAAASPTAG